MRGEDTAIEYDLAAGWVRCLVPVERRPDEPPPATPVWVESEMPVALREGVVIEAVLLSAREPGAGRLRRVVKPSGGLPTHVVHLRGESDRVRSLEVFGLSGETRFHETRVAPPPTLEDRAP